MIVYKKVCVPILAFGSENWTLTKKLRSGIHSMGMKYFRTVPWIT